MFKKSILFLFVTAMIVSLSTVSSAQDHGKMHAKKDTAKGEVAMGSLKTFTCPSPCDFSICSRDESELTSVAKMHGKKHHSMEMSDKDVKGMMKTEEMKKEATPKK